MFEQLPVRRRTGSWPPLRAWLTILAVALFLAGSAATHAQSETLADNARVISQAESDLRTVDRALDSRVERDVLAGLRAKALAAQQSARASESAGSASASLGRRRSTAERSRWSTAMSSSSPAAP